MSKQEVARALMAKKREHIDALKQINARLAQLGFKSSINAQKKPSGAQKKASAKKAYAKKTPAKKPNSGKSAPKIKATVKSMRTYLDSQGINVKSNASRVELENLIRKHNMVRKCEAYHSKDG